LILPLIDRNFGYTGKLMKSSFKYILAFSLMFPLAELSGQLGYRQIIGLNLATMSLTTEGKSYNPKISPGIHFGGSLDLRLARNLDFQPALVFSAKGSVYKTDSTEYSISPIYVEIPLILSYSFGWEAVKITMFAGPYFACGIGGNTLMTGGVFQNISYGSDANDDLKRFDIGLNAGGGLNIKGFLICAQYSVSLTNLAPDAKVETDIKNNVIGISFISSFGEKK
jgi:hypothetical protein